MARHGRYTGTTRLNVALDDRTRSPSRPVARREDMPVSSHDDEVSFVREIDRIFVTLSKGQEPLGAEFEAVWDTNVDILYRS